MSRSNILNKVKKRLGDENNVTRGRQIVINRLQAHEKNLIPDRSDHYKDHLDDLFVGETEQVTTTVDHVKDLDSVPSYIARYLADRNLPTYGLAPLN